MPDLPEKDIPNMVAQNKTNSENRHLVFLIFKKKHENEYQEYKTSIFGILFFLLKSSACRGFMVVQCRVVF